MSLVKRAAIPWNPIRRWSLRLSVGAVATWAAWLIVVQSGKHSAYEQHLLPGPFVYPLEAICRGIAFVLLEAVAVDFLLHYRAPAALWRRALVGGLAMLPISAFGATVFWDAPPYRAIQIVWLCLLNAFLLFVGAVSGAADFGGRAYRRFRVARGGSG